MTLSQKVLTVKNKLLTIQQEVADSQQGVANSQQEVADSSNERGAYVFRVTQLKKSGFRPFEPENENITLIRNVGDFIPTDWA